MRIAEEITGFTPAEGDEEPYWHELWLPFATDGGESQVIDLRPDSYGRLGWHWHWHWHWHDAGGDFSSSLFLEYWPSFRDYLVEIAEALVCSSDANGYVPYLDGEGMLLWLTPGTAESWPKPLRNAPVWLTEFCSQADPPARSRSSRSN